MLLRKDSVNPLWLDRLLAPMGEEETLSSVADAELLSAPGEDGVSTDLFFFFLISSGVV